MCLKEISFLLSCHSADEPQMKKSPAHLGHDCNGTLHQLVQVAVHHEVSEVDQRVIETGPDLLPALLRNPQRPALLLQTPPHQAVHLRPRRANQHRAPLTLQATVSDT